MKTFSYHSATAKVRRLGHGVIEVAYAGPMNTAAFDHLRARVLTVTQGASCLVLRMDRVLCLMGPTGVAPGDAYAVNRTPAAVLVRDDQFEGWDRYARQLARQGIMRAVFLAPFAPQALRWAQATADAAGRVALQ